MRTVALFLALLLGGAAGCFAAECTENCDQPVQAFGPDPGLDAGGGPQQKKKDEKKKEEGGGPQPQPQPSPPKGGQGGGQNSNAPTTATKDDSACNAGQMIVDAIGPGGGGAEIVDFTPPASCADKTATAAKDAPQTASSDFIQTRP